MTTPQLPPHCAGVLASHPIALGCDAWGGRSIVAERDLLAGELVLRERAFAYDLLPSHRDGARCDACFAPGDSLQRCVGCKQRYYCSTACQRLHWTTGGHKANCKFEKGGRSLDPSVALCAALLRREAALAAKTKTKTKTKKTKTKTKEEETILPPAAAWSDLLALTGREWPPPVKVAEPMEIEIEISAEASDAELLAAATEVRERVADVENSLLPPIELLALFRANNFAITTDTLVAAGSGVFPAAALLNHSCAPNCVVTFDLAAAAGGGTGMPPVLSLRTVRPVAAGEELMHSYVAIGQPAAQRRAALFASHRFFCRCDRCESRLLFEGLCDDADAHEAFAAAAPEHRECLVCGDLEGAIMVGRTLIEIHRALLGPHPHPVLGLALYTQGQLLSETVKSTALDEAAREGALLLREAREIFEVTHGAEHSLVRGLVAYFNDSVASNEHDKLPESVPRIDGFFLPGTKKKKKKKMEEANADDVAMRASLMALLATQKKMEQRPKDLPSLYPGPPPWLDSKNASWIDRVASVGGVPSHMMEFFLGNFRNQREMDARWRHLVYMYKGEGRNEEKDALPLTEHHRRWTEAGWDFSLVLRDNSRHPPCTWHEALELVGNPQMLTASGYTPPSPPLPRFCDCCGRQCTAECRCGEAYCNKDCQAKEWSNHRVICNTVAENSAIAMTLTEQSWGAHGALV